MEKKKAGKKQAEKNTFQMVRIERAVVEAMKAVAVKDSRSLTAAVKVGLIEYLKGRGEWAG